MKKEVANMDIRVLMLRNGVSQSALASVLGVTQSEVSTMLKYEMSRDQKRTIRDAIKELEAQL